MKINNLHRWDLTILQIKKLQGKFAGRVSHKKFFGLPKIIAGADCGLNLKKNKIYGVVALFNYPELEIIETQSAELPLTFPYVPGFLSFREAPVLLAAFKKLKNTPDLVFIDGHGIAHPRRLGIASHLGLWLDIPTIGCAKSVLVGDYASFKREKGNYSYLKHKGKIIGAALRTRNNCKPVFISIGHKINLECSLKFTLLCSDGYRIPKPTRIADKFIIL